MNRIEGRNSLFHCPMKTSVSKYAFIYFTYYYYLLTYLRAATTRQQSKPSPVVSKEELLKREGADGGARAKE